MKAAYTGTFDPITLGHTDMITRASAMFDELVVAIARSSAKNPLFTLEQRVDMAERALAHIPNVRVCGFSGLIIEFARQNGVTVLVRGVRNNTDFDYESQIAHGQASGAGDRHHYFAADRQVRTHLLHAGA